MTPSPIDTLITDLKALQDAIAKAGNGNCTIEGFAAIHHSDEEDPWGSMLIAEDGETIVAQNMNARSALAFKAAANFPFDALIAEVEAAQAEIETLTGDLKGYMQIAYDQVQDIDGHLAEIERLKGMLNPTIIRALEQFRIVDCFDDSEFGIAIDVFLASLNDKGGA